jgi:hypothetical protein
MCVALTRVFFDILQRERGGESGQGDKDEGKSRILFAVRSIKIAHFRQNFSFSVSSVCSCSSSLVAACRAVPLRLRLLVRQSLDGGGRVEFCLLYSAERPHWT